MAPPKSNERLNELLEWEAWEDGLPAVPADSVPLSAPETAPAAAAAKDRLGDIFDMQRAFHRHVRADDRYPGTTPARVSALCTAIIQEAAELQAVTDWKWWKKAPSFDAPHAKEELIDVLHFVIQAAIELGMSPEDVAAEYRRKTEINKQRQKDGY